MVGVYEKLNRQVDTDRAKVVSALPENGFRRRDPLLFNDVLELPGSWR